MVEALNHSTEEIIALFTPVGFIESLLENYELDLSKEKGFANAYIEREYERNGLAYTSKRYHQDNLLDYQVKGMNYDLEKVINDDHTVDYYNINKFILYNDIDQFNNWKTNDKDQDVHSIDGHSRNEQIWSPYMINTHKFNREHLNDFLHNLSDEYGFEYTLKTIDSADQQEYYRKKLAYGVNEKDFINDPFYNEIKISVGLPLITVKFSAENATAEDVENIKKLQSFFHTITK